ncbi:MAG: hypothetical protein ACJ71Q_09080 [Terriglobales bacterium]
MENGQTTASPALASDVENTERRSELDRWFNEHYEAITEQLSTQVTLDRFEDALCRIAADLPRCRAKTPEQFQKWIERRIAKFAADVRDENAIDALSLEEALAGPYRERKNTKDFIYEVHGDKAFIRVERKDEIFVWIIPKDWLPIARRLWPVHIRFYASGPYLAKKVPRGIKGNKEQITVPLHRLFVDCGGQKLVGDHSSQSVVAKNGNYLDWTNDNLGQLKPWTSRDLMDCWDRDDDQDVEKMPRPEDPAYAKPKRAPAKNDPRYDGGQLWSRFDSGIPKADYINLSFSA